MSEQHYVQSPIELRPQFIEEIGRICARWAVLENALAELMGRFLRVDHAGHAAIFALNNFSQRLSLVASVAKYSVKDDLHLRIITRLIEKINSLWNKRNYLVHSHYVHQTEFADGISVMLVGDAKINIDEASIGSPDDEGVKKEHFGYLKRSRDGGSTFVPVNLGSFENHASKVARRARQLMAVVKALDTGIITLRRDSQMKYGRVSPRATNMAALSGTRPGEAYTSRVIGD